MNYRNEQNYRNEHWINGCQSWGQVRGCSQLGNCDYKRVAQGILVVKLFCFDCDGGRTIA